VTDRYVRRGGDIPRIYPGTLKALEQAIEDIERVSRFQPLVIYSLVAVQGHESKIIRTYKSGLRMVASEVR
jgi:hypothetical protein